MNDPDLPDAVAKEFAAQIVNTRSKLATLEAQRNRLEGLISIESMKADALKARRADGPFECLQQILERRSYQQAIVKQP